MRTARLILLTAAVFAACAAVAWQIWGRDDASRSHFPAAVTPRREQPQAPPSLLPPPSTATSVSTTITNPQPTASQSSTVHSSMRPYEDTDNLAQLVGQLTPAAESGDWRSAWMVAQALDECLPQSTNPTLYATTRARIDDVPLEQRASLLRHLDRSELRCKQLVADGQLSRARVLDAFDTAMRDSNLANRATALVNSPESLAESDAKEMIRQILESQDPWAIWALSEVMGERQDEGHDYGPFSGSKVHRWAWKFVACRLGYPCGPDSAEVRKLCIVQGRCANAPLEGIAQQFYLTPVQFQEATAETEELIRMIAARNIRSILP